MPIDAQLDVTVSAEPSHNTLVVDAPSDSDIPMNPFMNLMSNGTTSTQFQWLASLDQGLITERPSSPVDGEVMTAYQEMASFCVSPILLLPFGRSLVAHN